MEKETFVSLLFGLYEEETPERRMKFQGICTAV